MVQSQKMTSGTMKGNKLSFTSVRFQACSEITLGREDPTLLHVKPETLRCMLARLFLSQLFY